MLRVRSRLGWLAFLGSVLLILGLTAIAAGGPSLAGARPPVLSGGPSACLPGWQLVSSPNPGDNARRLGGVAAIAPGKLWAVGEYFAPTHVRPLALRWGGTDFDIVPSPYYYGSRVALDAVVALRGEAWAVGNSGGQDLAMVALHWDGTAWVFLPPVPARHSWLRGVAAIGPGDMWAVGQISVARGQPVETLIVRGSPTGLTRVPSPNAGTSAALNAVAVAGANDAWAVGWSQGAMMETLIERWNGTAWTVVPSPSVAGADTELTGVTVIGPNEAWAVGSITYPQTPPVPLILHWDGAAWSMVAQPVFRGTLTGVSGTVPTDVWAVGYDDVGATLTLHWNGTAWSQIPSINPGDANRFNAVTMLAATDVWAVGSYVDGAGVQKTLVAHYTDECPPWGGLPPPTPTTLARPKP